MKTLKQRLLSKLDITKPSGCWNWTASTDRYGYGKISVGKKYRKAYNLPRDTHAHRVSYRLFKGRIPAGLFVMHTCDNPACCNPDHLKLGTNEENTQDRHAKGRSAKGEQIGNSKITAAIAVEIRNAPGKVRDIAKVYGVGKSLVSYIKRKEIWKHV